MIKYFSGCRDLHVSYIWLSYLGLLATLTWCQGKMAISNQCSEMIAINVGNTPTVAGAFFTLFIYSLYVNW